MFMAKGSRRLFFSSETLDGVRKSVILPIFGIMDSAPMSENPPTAAPRQRLLYLHGRTPNVFSDVIAMTLIEPVRGYASEISAGEQDWPYSTVHDAVVDGWQIVQFPHQQAPINDRDLDVVGYEFILQKMEVIP